MPYMEITTTDEARDAANQIALLKRYRRFAETFKSHAEKQEDAGKLFDEVRDEIGQSVFNITYTIDCEIEHLESRLADWEDLNNYGPDTMARDESRALLAGVL